MKRLSTLFILMVLLLLGMVSATVIEDTFSDGDYTSNPTWILGAGTANVTNGEFILQVFLTPIIGLQQ